jgi:predicted PurR-regulated permease PerM
VAALRDTLLGSAASSELNALVRSAVDEALSAKSQGEVDALLDSAEPHLEMLVAEVIEGVTPELQASLKSTTNAAANDLASLKGYFVWVVAGLGGLLVLVLAIIVALIVMMRAHRKLSTRVRNTEWWRKG